MSEILLAQTRRGSVDAGFEHLVRDFIESRGGIKGIAYRAGFAMIEKAKPGILQRGVQKLLPLFMQALDPLYAEFQKAGAKGDFAGYLQKNARQASAALIAVADARMEKASDTARKYYGKFRGGAEDEVQALIPKLARLIQSHL